MTTLGGIKAKKGKKVKAIVVVADSRHEELNSAEEEISSRGPKFDVHGSSGREYILGMYGTTGGLAREAFLKYINGKIPYEEFRELAGKNLDVGGLSSQFYPSPEFIETVSEVLEGTDKKGLEASVDQFLGDRKHKVKNRRTLIGLLRQIGSMETDPVLEAIRSGRFHAFAELQSYAVRRKKRDEDEEDLTGGLLIATRKPLELYEVDSHGNTKVVSDDEADPDFSALGSGAYDFRDYIQRELFLNDPEVKNVRLKDTLKRLDLGELSLDDTRCLSFAAASYAADRDRGSGGFIHMGVVTGDGITVSTHSVDEALGRMNEDWYVDNLLFGKDDDKKASEEGDGGDED